LPFSLFLHSSYCLHSFLPFLHRFLSVLSFFMEIIQSCPFCFRFYLYFFVSLLIFPYPSFLILGLFSASFLSIYFAIFAFRSRDISYVTYCTPVQNGQRIYIIHSLA
jgi:hypothetical protein